MHLSHSVEASTPTADEPLYTLDFGATLDVTKAPPVPCIYCGRTLPLVTGHVGYVTVAGQCVSYVSCHPCTLERVEATPAYDADPATRHAAFRRQSVRLKRLCAIHRASRLVPVARALLQNAAKERA
jgi:hypothetical protein